MKRRGPQSKPSSKNHGLSVGQLEELVEQATTDAYGDSEQATGFLTMMEDNLRLPFETQILGVTVSVRRIDITDRDELVAICRNGEHRQRVPLTELPLPSPPPDGWEWIAAYCYFRRESDAGEHEEDEE